VVLLLLLLLFWPASTEPWAVKVEAKKEIIIVIIIILIIIINIFLKRHKLHSRGAGGSRLCMLVKGLTK